jgi:hypothetical protein
VISVALGSRWADEFETVFKAVQQPSSHSGEGRSGRGSRGKAALLASTLSALAAAQSTESSRPTHSHSHSQGKNALEIEIAKKKKKYEDEEEEEEEEGGDGESSVESADSVSVSTMSARASSALPPSAKPRGRGRPSRQQSAMESSRHVITIYSYATAERVGGGTADKQHLLLSLADGRETVKAEALSPSYISTAEELSRYQRHCQSRRNRLGTNVSALSERGQVRAPSPPARENPRAEVDECLLSKLAHNIIKFSTVVAEEDGQEGKGRRGKGGRVLLSSSARRGEPSSRGAAQEEPTAATRKRRLTETHPTSSVGEEERLDEEENSSHLRGRRRRTEVDREAAPIAERRSGVSDKKDGQSTSVEGAEDRNELVEVIMSMLAGRNAGGGGGGGGGGGSSSSVPSAEEAVPREEASSSSSSSSSSRKGKAAARTASGQNREGEEEERGRSVKYIFLCWLRITFSFLFDRR